MSPLHIDAASAVPMSVPISQRSELRADLLA
jgi:hypothetical protein